MKTNLRKLKRELACYRTFHANMQAYFKVHPEIRNDISLWLLLRSLAPPDGGRRKPIKRAA